LAPPALLLTPPDVTPPAWPRPPPVLLAPPAPLPAPPDVAAPVPAATPVPPVPPVPCVLGGLAASLPPHPQRTATVPEAAPNQATFEKKSRTDTLFPFYPLPHNSVRAPTIEGRAGSKCQKGGSAAPVLEAAARTPQGCPVQVTGKRFFDRGW